MTGICRLRLTAFQWAAIRNKWTDARERTLTYLNTTSKHGLFKSLGRSLFDLNPCSLVANVYMKKQLLSSIVDPLCVDSKLEADHTASASQSECRKYVIKY